MNVLIILCHPISASFNAQVASAACAGVAAAGHDFRFHDLYREEFDPVLAESEFLSKFSLDSGVQDYMDQVLEADAMIFVHPDWWGQMPSLLKGWLDRVFRPGIAYEYAGDEFLPKHRELPLAGKRALAYCTTDAAETAVAHPLIKIWEESIFDFCGIRGTCRMFHSAWRSEPLRRRAWLAQIPADLGELLTNEP